MNALPKLSDEMNAEQFSDRLNDIYNELLNLLDVDRPRAQSLICAALSFSASITASAGKSFPSSSSAVPETMLSVS